MEPSVTGNPIPSNRDTLLTQWRQAQKLLDEVKAKEAVLRKQVIEAFSEVGEMYSGVENVDVGWGHQLKIEHKLDYKLDSTDDYARVDKVLDKIEDTIEHGPLLVDRLVKRTLNISIAEYKKLPPAAKRLIDEVLTIKPASKSVKLEPVKGAS